MIQTLPRNFQETAGPESILWSRPEAGRRLLIVHGFGENAFRYRQFTHYLGDIYSHIEAVQLPGHGTAPGKRGDCQSLESFVVVVEKALLKNQSTDQPTDLLGHSFGGLLALWMLKNQRLHGVRRLVTSAPALALAARPPWLKRIGGEALRWVAPHLAIPADIDARLLSRLPHEVETYQQDPLNHPWITARTFFEMSRAMSEVLTWQGPLSLPWGLLLPGSDRLIDPQVSFQFFLKMKESGPNKKTLLSFPGHLHESFNDKDRSPVFQALHGYLA